MIICLCRAAGRFVTHRLLESSSCSSCSFSHSFQYLQAAAASIAKMGMQFPLPRDPASSFFCEPARSATTETRVVTFSSCDGVERRPEGFPWPEGIILSFLYPPSHPPSFSIGVHPFLFFPFCQKGLRVFMCVHGAVWLLSLFSNTHTHPS